MSGVLNKEHYFHFRTHDEKGNVMAKGGATVCYFPVDEDRAVLGVSVCSHMDNFCRNTGRNKSRGDAIRILSNHPEFIIQRMDMEKAILEAKTLVIYAAKRVFDRKTNAVQERLRSEQSTLDVAFDQVMDSMLISRKKTI